METPEMATKSLMFLETVFMLINVTSDLKAARSHTFWPPLYLVLKMAPIQYKVGIWKSVCIYYYHYSLNNHHM